MDQDFPTSPAKRQRTVTPERPTVLAEAEKETAVDNAGTKPDVEPTIDTISINNLLESAGLSTDHGPPGANSFLDVLMQQVEAESEPVEHPDAAINALTGDGHQHAPLHTDVQQQVVADGKLEAAEDEQNDTPNANSGVDPVPNPIPEEKSANQSILDEEQKQEQNMSTSQIDTKDVHEEQKQTADAAKVATDPEAIGVATNASDQASLPQPEADAQTIMKQDEDTAMDSSIDMPEKNKSLGLHEDGQPSSDPQRSFIIDGEAALSTSGNLQDGNDTTAQGPEWEADSSPYESSSDSDSSDTTSSDEDDSDDDADGDYAMMDPEEQARILMQGDGGSDDEGGPSKTRGEGAGLRTANEKVEEIVPLPEITVTEEMKIEELGNVEATVESTILIKAKTSGEYQVLESGSLLCLADRKVIGVVAETLGRVEQPLYTVRFTNDKAIEDIGLAGKGTVVHYVVAHSKFVFTQPLKGFKGSDASNFHDEEIGDDEMEFSDDEAEAEHKRQLKLKRQNRRDDGVPQGRGGRGGTRHRGNRQGSVVSITAHSETNGGPADGALNYDDNAGDDDYTPLARPSNLHEMMGQSGPREAAGTNHLPLPLPPPPPQQHQFNRGRGNHQTFRGRGGRGNQRGRGGFNQQNNRQNAFNNDWQNRSFPTQQPHAQQHYGVPPPPPPPPPPLHYPQQQLHQQQYQYPQQYQQSPYPPQPPSLVPQPMPYSTPVSPSPISPLPKSQFGFGNYSNQGFQGPTPQQQYQYPTQYQQQIPGQYVPQPPIPGLNMNSGNGRNGHPNSTNNGYNHGYNNGQNHGPAQ